MKVQIQSDGVTVWVHTVAGTIARFGRNGIDVHTADTMACLHCTHEPTTAKDWPIFQVKMLEHHSVRVTNDHRPIRFNS